VIAAYGACVSVPRLPGHSPNTFQASVLWFPTGTQQPSIIRAGFQMSRKSRLPVQWQRILNPFPSSQSATHTLASSNCWLQVLFYKTKSAHICTIWKQNVQWIIADFSIIWKLSTTRPTLAKKLQSDPSLYL
jgi:hypothetical protein